MKTPDETKKGLECCGGDCFNGNEECPYDKDDLKENISCIRWMSKDALAYIQQLEAQVPKWISVEERLPEDDDDVLMMTDMGMSMGYYCRDSFIDSWVDYVNSDSKCVTHWMPLPEPPKEDNHVQK